MTYPGLVSDSLFILLETIISERKLNSFDHPHEISENPQPGPAIIVD